MVAAKKSSKTAPKRLARDSDRAYAAELVRLYRTQEKVREEIPGGFVIESRVDGDQLAYELEVFARRGTWAKKSPLTDHKLTYAGLRPDGRVEEISLTGWLRLAARHEFDELRRELKNRGEKRAGETSIGILAERYQVIDTTIRDAVYRHPKNTKV